MIEAGSTPFDFDAPRTRIVLRDNAIAMLPDLLADLGVSRPLLVSGGRSLSGPVGTAVREALGDRLVGTFDGIVEHSSSDAVMQGAVLARDLKIDGLIAVGGGSASDTAKGIAIVLAEGGHIDEHASTFIPPDTFRPKPLPAPKLPVIAVPTTASAAEVTPGLGIRDAQGVKRLFWDVKLASRLIVLDPVANLSVPASVMAQTGMNAFAHCAEGLYSRLRNPISEGLALQGIRILSRAIPAMVAEPDNPRHRADVLTGAHISGQVISNARVGIHHAVCHCLGARGGLSHGVANSVMLPYAVAYNLDVAAPEIARMAEPLGVSGAGRGETDLAKAATDAIRHLQKVAQVPSLLRETTLDRALLPAIAEDAMKDRGLYFNPKPTHSPSEVLALLESAW